MQQNAIDIMKTQIDHLTSVKNPQLMKFLGDHFVTLLEVASSYIHLYNDLGYNCVNLTNLNCETALADRLAKVQEQNAREVVEKMRAVTESVSVAVSVVQICGKSLFGSRWISDGIPREGSYCTKEEGCDDKCIAEEIYRDKSC
eukprot:TRINITY_DN4312_c0_g6_i2.p1 TRINITY_DN4312_c0_g6~~TRINITY_DN4312_c0_g6_i2.p1  ORF type:complete len:144 (-),score=12.83 TRINITY_DN4312_c0_g6_i2:129-560(-)